MQLRSLPRSFARLPYGSSLSPPARTRLQALTVWQQTGDWRLAAQVFHISRATLYRWRQQYRPADLGSLACRSRRPHRVRRSTVPITMVERLLTLRRQYPRWGREKLRVLLAREGIHLSAKTIDRVLTRLRVSGQLIEPPRRAISAHRRRPRSYATRKPRNYVPEHPGDLVQVDTLDVRPLPGVVLKQFTARDVVSRWDVVEAYRRATSITATQFLTTLQRRMPMPIRAIQVDGGSEFAAAFEQACQQRGIRLFVLPPPLPETQRGRRTGEPDPYRGVL